MKTEILELSFDDLAAVAGGDKKPAPGSTGSADLDQALDKAKALVAACAAQLGGAIK